MIGVLARGDRVIATARKDISRLKHLENGGAAVFELDVTSPATEIKNKMAEIIKIYGGVDVLVNNAGYIEAGMVEEASCVSFCLRILRSVTQSPSHEQYLAQFNTNVFGVINVRQALLPNFRQKRSGYVIFVGSSGAWAGSPGAGPYCGTRFALEGKHCTVLWMK
jgi:NAD(P)-dependent dehydrogenase (short-subunit alcohol dehydrogenase family)